MNVRMLVEFVDGSKTMVEMAAIANATGLVPDKPGHAWSRRRRSASSTRCWCPQKDGGVLSRKSASSTIRSARASRPASSSSPTWRIRAFRERMEDLKMGKGPYFTFYRPYHLTCSKCRCPARASCSTARPTWCRCRSPVAEVCAVAKKDLKPGDKLDAIGEYCYRAWIMTRRRGARRRRRSPAACCRAAR